MLVLLEGRRIEELLAFALLTLDETACSGRETDLSAEVVQFHLLSFAHLGELSLPAEPLALHRGILHALLVPSVIFFQFIGKQLGPTHFRRLEALSPLSMALEISGGKLLRMKF